MEIQIRDLHKSFGDNAVLRGLSLTIRSGEVTVILGGSGSGKSVLLKHIIGLIKPDSGQVLIDGQDIVPLGEQELNEIRRRIGIIFQNGGLLQSLTVGQNVGLALVEHELAPRGEIRRIVAEKLALVGLEGKESEMPANLSGGMRKRAAIARALTVDADALLYDEPTAGLDPPMSKTVDDLIIEMKTRTGCTSVVVTHDLVSVFAIADSIHMLHQGEIVFSGTPKAMLECTDERVRSFLERGRLPGGGMGSRLDEKQAATKDAPLGGASPESALKTQP